MCLSDPLKYKIIYSISNATRDDVRDVPYSTGLENLI